jgi:hypothetical protein
MRSTVQPWMLFALPAGMVIAIAAGFLLGGPVVGLIVAIVIALAIVATAIRTDPDPHEAPGDHAWRRRAARRFLLPLAIAIAGTAVVAVTDSETAHIIGWGIVAVAAAIAVSLVFLEIGLSEDRDRARHPRG